MREPGTFLWNELFTSDTQGAARFYSQLLGWQPFNPDTVSAGAAAAPHTVWMMGFNQVGSMRRHVGEGTMPMWLPFIAVEDVDRSAQRAAELGGSVISEPFDVPNSGRFAILRDPQGAIFGVGQPMLSENR